MSFAQLAAKEEQEAREAEEKAAREEEEAKAAEAAAAKEEEEAVAAEAVRQTIPSFLAQPRATPTLALTTCCWVLSLIHI